LQVHEWVAYTVLRPQFDHSRWRAQPFTKVQTVAVM
jgi:hypothetical protein